VANDPLGGPLGSGSPSGFVTLILKSGSIGVGTLNGVDFGDLSLTAVIPEPSSMALVAAGAAAAPFVWRLRRRRSRLVS
jgi:hypothetical protein